MARQSKQEGGKTEGDPLAVGTEERFLKAFDDYADALFRHAVYRLSDRERAIDLVHDAFTKVWGYVRGGYEVASYRSFLYKVLNNLIIDEYRRRKEVSLDALLDEEGTDEGSFTELHEGGMEELSFSLDAKRVHELIPKLPPIYREVITLRFIDGLGPKEISELIEESENVVSVRIHRALQLLKTQITEHENRIRTERKKHI